MNKRLVTIKRSLVLLALGGATLGLFGTSFGPGGNMGCNYATYDDYAQMFTTSGQSAIQTLSDGLFGGIGTDFDAWVRNPGTTLAQNAWANWVDTRVPDSIGIHSIQLR